MKKATWFVEMLEKYKDDLEFRMEGVILEFTEKIVQKMEELDINRSELAERLGVSKAFVTKLLNGNPNLTIKTMMSLADVLGCDLNLDLYPKGFEKKNFYVYTSMEGCDREVNPIPATDEESCASAA